MWPAGQGATFRFFIQGKIPETTAIRSEHQGVPSEHPFPAITKTYKYAYY